MEDNKESQREDTNQSQKQQDEPLPVHNPFGDDKGKKITQEDIDNEQKYKEALTERD